jgi:hypothetical protein
MIQNCKPETRNPKFETNSNDHKSKGFKRNQIADSNFLDFGFEVRFVSDFELRISDLMGDKRRICQWRTQTL